jgi:hypothetical protein
MMLSSHEGVDEYPPGFVGSLTKNTSLGWLLTKSSRDKTISPKRYSVARIPVAVGRITTITVIGLVPISIPTIAAS